jgi:enamine deaminase RidA (YjgF/YER057c/UK114 family)
VADSHRRYRDGSGWEDRAGYSRAVRRFGHIAVSGTTANAPDGHALHPGDTYRQTSAAIQAALVAVRALGGEKDDVVRTRIYLTPEADWESAARAHVEHLGAIAPANTMLRVAGLIGEDFLVEVEMDAVIRSDDS